MSEDIPADVRDFLNRHIRSVGQLDILYLLISNPERVWTSQQVTAELRTNAGLAEAHLRGLADKHLILIDGDGFRAGEDKAASEIISKTIYVYNLRRPAVIHFIYSRPNESIRNFADAFKLKKDGD